MRAARSAPAAASCNRSTQTNSTTPVPPSMNIPPVTGPPPASTIPGYTYQILRMPRRIGNPLELAPGTCIDVAYCGIGPTNLPSNKLAYGMYPDPATTLV